MKPANTALLAAFALAAAPALADDLTVSAAASLKEAFQEINAAYQKAHPDTAVKLNTAASGVLLQQLAQGAPVDVLATADQTTMDKAQEQNLIDQSHRRTFALNDLVVVQPKDSRLKIKTLADLKAATVLPHRRRQPRQRPRRPLHQRRAGKSRPLHHAAAQNRLHPKRAPGTRLRRTRRNRSRLCLPHRCRAGQRQSAHRLRRSPGNPRFLRHRARRRRQKQSGTASYVDFVLSPAGQTILKKYGFSPAKGSKAK
ncbi:molybdate ABC transporter substrate-binding protein [Kingella potus]|uniref:molybdate ABC transporter substrate-binding protein n=1 Tax=Kingella potus TaxID=265175 RepID=UPI003CC7DCF6